jgi:hypothetical protein
VELVCVAAVWLVVTAVWGVVVESIIRRRERRDRRGRPILTPRCARCGYLLVRVPEWRCPECGVPLSGNVDY